MYNILYFIQQVIILVELSVKKRKRHDTVRPAIDLPIEDWNNFSVKYKTSAERSEIIQKLILLQLDTEIVN